MKQVQTKDGSIGVPFTGGIAASFFIGGLMMTCSDNPDAFWMFLASIALAIISFFLVIMESDTKEKLFMFSALVIWVATLACSNDPSDFYVTMGFLLLGLIFAVISGTIAISKKTKKR